MGVWYGMVKKSRESFWCFRGHGVELFSFRCHLLVDLWNFI
jgi:hypothetical protein